MQFSLSHRLLFVEHPWHFQNVFQFYNLLISESVKFKYQFMSESRFEGGGKIYLVVYDKGSGPRNIHKLKCSFGNWVVWVRMTRILFHW